MLQLVSSFDVSFCLSTTDFLALFTLFAINLVLMNVRLRLHENIFQTLKLMELSVINLQDETMFHHTIGLHTCQNTTETADL